MIVINGVLATVEDIKRFNQEMNNGKIEIKFLRIGECFINIVTNV